MSDSTAELAPARSEERHDRAGAEQEAASESAFSRSIVISGIRCVLTYVIFPFVLPVIGLADIVGPAIGLPIGIVAILANLFSIRRFHASGHRLRWPISAVNVAIIGLLTYLVIEDLQALL